MNAAFPSPVLIPAANLLGIDAEGIRFLDPEGAARRLRYADCADPLPTASQTPAHIRLIGFRDASAPQPWIELATVPPLRVLFEPGAVRSTHLGGRFVRRERPPGFDAFLEAVGRYGFGFGDRA